MHVIQHGGTNVFYLQRLAHRSKGKRSAETMTLSLLKSSGISFFARGRALLFSLESLLYHKLRGGPERMG